MINLPTSKINLCSCYYRITAYESRLIITIDCLSYTRVQIKYFYKKQQTDKTKQ